MAASSWCPHGAESPIKTAFVTGGGGFLGLDLIGLIDRQLLNCKLSQNSATRPDFVGPMRGSGMGYGRLAELEIYRAIAQGLDAVMLNPFGLLGVVKVRITFPVSISARNRCIRR